MQEEQDKFHWGQHGTATSAATVPAAAALVSPTATQQAHAPAEADVVGLNMRIVEAPDTTALLQLHSRYAGQLDHHHIYMLVMRLAEAGSQPAASEALQHPDKEALQAELVAAIQQLQAAAITCISKFSEPQMASMLWSLATLASAVGTASSNSSRMPVVHPELLQAVSTTWAAHMAPPSSWSMQVCMSSFIMQQPSCSAPRPQ